MRAPGWVRSGGSPVPIAPRIPPAVRVGDCTESPWGSGGLFLPLRLAAHPIPLPRGETEAQLGSPPQLQPEPLALFCLPQFPHRSGKPRAAHPQDLPALPPSHGHPLPQHPASHTPIVPNRMECGTPKPSPGLQGSVCPPLPAPIALQVLSWDLCMGTPWGSQVLGRAGAPPLFSSA